MSIEFVALTVEKIRERLRKMTDEKLVRFGKAAREVCSSANRATIADEVDSQLKQQVPRFVEPMKQS